MTYLKKNKKKTYIIFKKLYVGLLLEEKNAIKLRKKKHERTNVKQVYLIKQAIHECF